MDTVFYILIFILFAGSFYLLASNLANLKQRPRLLLALDTPVDKRHPLFSFRSSALPKLLKPLNVLTRPFTKLTYIKRLQEQADVLRINLNLTELILLKLFLGVFIGIMVFVLLKPVYALPLAIVGFFIPDFLMWNKIKAKKAIIERIFPETIDLLDLCISAGQDFLSAVKWVIDKSEFNPFIEQLGIVLGEIQVGKPRVEALKDMSKKLRIADISSFVRTIIQAERMGTSIEEAFKNLSDDTRDRRFQAGERYAIKASLKILFPLLFCILPAIMIVVAGPILIKFMQGEMLPKTGF